MHRSAVWSFCHYYLFHFLSQCFVCFYWVAPEANHNSLFSCLQCSVCINSLIKKPVNYIINFNIIFPLFINTEYHLPKCSLFIKEIISIKDFRLFWLPFIYETLLWELHNHTAFSCDKYINQQSLCGVCWFSFWSFILTTCL